MKVCVTLDEQSCTQTHFTHRPGEPVPVQLAGHIDQNRWTTFLTECETGLPRASPLVYVSPVLILGGMVLPLVHGET